MNRLGIEEIYSIFGKFTYTELGNGLVHIDHSWISNNLIFYNFPVAGLLKCHKKIQPQLLSVFKEINEIKLNAFITMERGGCCYSPRHTKWDQRLELSRHCWGVAVDLNVKYNQPGRISDNSLSFNRNKSTKGIIELFEKYGFEWGEINNPSHFEWARFV